MLRLFDTLFKPDEYHPDLLAIDYQNYVAQGIRLVMIDIDNTLARHGSHEADEYALSAVARIQAAGLTCWIVSNAAHKRVHLFATSIGLPYVAQANKPSRRALKTVLKSTDIAASQAVMIGDQLLTDIMAANRSGCRSVLVKPRFEHEAWNVKMKRAVEKLALRRYKLQ